MTFNFSPWTFLLVLGRTGTLVGFLPILSDGSVPKKIRIGLACWLSVAIVPTLPPSKYQPNSLLDLGVAIGLESLVGLLFAFITRILFAGIFLGAQWIDGEIGFQAAQQINPISGTPNSPFGTLMMVVTSLLFWCLGYFEDLIALWARIFQILPVPITGFSSLAGDALVKLTSQIFLRALEIVTPILTVMFLVTLTIGLMARAVQGVNIFVDSYNIKLLIGIGTLVTIAPLMLTLVQKQVGSMLDYWMVVLHALKGIP
jgi:flagellar biosynthesis protein FliR